MNNKKKIFFKNKQSRYINISLIIVLISISLYVFFIDTNSSDTFIINEYKNKFYFIPKDKGGKIIDNLDKKSLHLSKNDDQSINLNLDIDLNYSIQLFTSLNYLSVINEMNRLKSINKEMFNNDNLYIVLLNTAISSEYFLLYKNFMTRNLALNYCNKYAFFLDKCFIVNVQNFD